jgi:hypothetical protein
MYIPADLRHDIAVSIYVEEGRKKAAAYTGIVVEMWTSSVVSATRIRKNI